MTTSPSQSAEHDALMQMLMKAIANSSTINGLILVTINFEGLPCIAGNFPVEAIQEVFHALGESDNEISGVEERIVPETN